MIPEDIQEGYRRLGAWSGLTVPAAARAQQARGGGAIAYLDADRRLSLSEALEAARRVAGGLASAGISPGDVVAWQLPNWWEAAVIHLAALTLGAIPAPIGPGLRESELEPILAEARPSAFVVPTTWRSHDHASMAADLAGAYAIGLVVTVRGHLASAIALDELLTHDLHPWPDHRDPASPALLMYTSGTTGHPKGVVHTHRSLLAEIRSFETIHALTPADRLIGGAPVSHIAGLMYGVLAPVVLGTSTVLLDRWEPERALDAIAQDGATFMTGPPTFLQTLAEPPRGARDLSSFRLFSTGGARIPSDAVREAGARLGCVVKRAYGSTEVPTLTATLPGDDEHARIETDGRPVEPAEVRIVDPDGIDVRPGAEGEIWGRAPEMLEGYRSAVDGAFADGGWFRTGDLGRLDDRGLLHVVGRRSDIIIRGGENISAAEVEALIQTHPAVAAVAVLPVPDEVLGERTCAVIEPAPGGAVTLDSIVEHLRAQNVATHKLPERLVVMQDLPRTASGKVAKAALRARLEP